MIGVRHMRLLALFAIDAESDENLCQSIIHRWRFAISGIFYLYGMLLYVVYYEWVTGVM